MHDYVNLVIVYCLSFTLVTTPLKRNAASDHQHMHSKPGNHIYDHRENKRTKQRGSGIPVGNREALSHYTYTGWIRLWHDEFLQTCGSRTIRGVN